MSEFTWCPKIPDFTLTDVVSWHLPVYIHFSSEKFAIAVQISKLFELLNLLIVVSKGDDGLE